MTTFKSVQLKLLKMKYGGDSIGRNIRVETEILGKFLRIDKRIKPGVTIKVNQEISKFKTDQKSLQTKISIIVIEKDLLFNDVGNAGKNLKIITTTTKPQQFAIKVPVKETRSVFGKFWGTRTAVFEVTLEAIVSDFIKYAPDLDESQGFLNIKLEKNESKKSLPAYLKIRIEHADAKREYFTILEGPYRSELASVGLKNSNSSWFISGVKYKSGARAKYSISQKLFILNDEKYKTVDYPKSIWKKGLYDIEIPDYPHKGGRNYLDKSKRAMTWFRIGHGGERYLHTGGRSLGCITIIETHRWIEIYNTLIKARKGDFMSIGVLEVVD